MNLSKLLSLRRADFTIGFAILLVSFFAVFGSRQIRLASEDAVFFEKKTRLTFSAQSGIPELTILFDSLSVDYNSKELEWSAKMLGWRTFRKGSYLLEGEYSYELLLSKLARGIQDPVDVVILPGINKERFADAISSKLNFSATDLEIIFEDSLFLDDLSLSSEELFGRMLPETYLIYWTSSPKDVVRRILREFNEKVSNRFNDSIEQQGLTISQIVTMASIVEWEANKEEEKPIISGLYWNRFNRNMRLQADPTVNFALGERRRLLFEDYELDHPFNTYRNKGLPPAPIANPSLSTIEATVFPEQHNFLYMVANPEGGHIFTRTFAEHQVESEKWRKWLRQQYRIKRQREAEGALND